MSTFLRPTPLTSLKRVTTCLKIQFNDIPNNTRDSLKPKNTIHTCVPQYNAIFTQPFAILNAKFANQ